MKTKQLLLSLLMLCVATINYAQSSAEQSGIAVQGIARDANNTAIASSSISMTFDLYYFNDSNSPTTIFSETLNVQTDAFGVFSHVIANAVVNDVKFANYKAFLRIKKGTEIISDEKLQHVPYAIAANNGVPTGSIMPFVGSVIPKGWLLCNGAATVPVNSPLYVLLGNSTETPNLNGMFLRGTGTSAVNNQNGPSLRGTQGDTFKQHKHSGRTNTDGKHGHGGNNVIYSASSNVGNEVIMNTKGTKSKLWDSNESNHDHVFTTDNAGAGETRPVNYGVNYIIKL
ncbi:tail fiber protein [Mariniflexile sp. AS56]|uniref:tail fiber protein n=1 Tax=Mariniflexile sp. AS56 TaxID=3063957 RepID=UPI0026EEA58C|nr:tail fiber protein [Mariniflexile sp. AS56]MDO7171830.1 tail fiber protein [Mariniflexile sp. AS56]